MERTLVTEQRKVLTRWPHALAVGGAYVFLASTYISIAVNSLSMGLMAAALLGTALTERKWPVARTPFDFYFLGFVIIQTISTLFSSDPLQSLILSKRVLLVGLVYFFATIVNTEGKARNLVTVLLGTATVVALLGVLKLATGGPGDNTRLNIFQFYMTTSELLTTATLLLFPFAIHPITPRKVRLLAIFALIPVLISLWATVTRGAYLAAISGLVFVAIVRNRRLLLPIGVGITILFFFAPTYVRNRVESIIDVNHPENIARVELWKAGIKIFKDHPIVGVGDIDTGHLIDQYADPSLPRIWGHLHNTPLQLLVNYGILGFVALIGMFVKIFSVEWEIFSRVKNSWFEGSFALGTLAALVAFFVSGLTEWTFGDQEVITLVWSTLGILLGIARLADQNAAVC